MGKRENKGWRNGVKKKPDWKRRGEDLRKTPEKKEKTKKKARGRLLVRRSRETLRDAEAVAGLKNE